jgi:metal transporter CNNM
MLAVCLLHLFAPLVKAFPVVQRAIAALEDEDPPKDPADASLWAYLGVAVALVLLGGVFAGLTIA